MRLKTLAISAFLLGPGAMKASAINGPFTSTNIFITSLSSGSLNITYGLPTGTSAHVWLSSSSDFTTPLSSGASCGSGCTVATSTHFFRGASTVTFSYNASTMTFMLPNTKFYFRMSTAPAASMSSGEFGSFNTDFSTVTFAASALEVSIALSTAGIKVVYNTNSNPLLRTTYTLTASTSPSFSASPGTQHQISISTIARLTIDQVHLDSLFANATYFLKMAVSNHMSTTTETRFALTVTSAQAVSEGTVVRLTDGFTINYDINSNQLHKTTFTFTASTSPFFSASGGAPNQVVVSSVASTNVVPITYSGLSSNTTYFFHAASLQFNSSSTQIQFTGRGTLARSPGTSGTPFTSIGVSTIAAQWDANSNPVGITTFTLVASKLFLDPSSNGEAFPDKITVSTVAVTTGPVGSLTPNTTYHFYVAALDNFSGTSTTFTYIGSTATLARTPLSFNSFNPALFAFSTTPVRGGDSLTIQWRSDGNPSAITTYTVVASTMSDFSPTQFEVRLETAPISTSLATATLSGLKSMTTYFLQVQAVNHNKSTTPFVTLGSTVTKPLPVTGYSVTGAGLVKALYGTWTDTDNPALGQKYLAELSTNSFSTLVNQALVTVTSVTFAGLTDGQLYQFRVTVISPFSQGNDRSADSTLVRTLPLQIPGSPAVTAFSAYAATVTWNANDNPSGVSYEAVTALDASFANVLSTTTVSVTTAQITALLPASTYFFKIRAIHSSFGIGIFSSTVSVVTKSLASISQSSAPLSPYSTPAQLRGLWHFDSALSSATVLADASSFNSSATLTCLNAACASTPTVVSGKPGLGLAVEFSGVANSLARVSTNAASLGFTGSLTVSAWVRPATLAQPTGASLITKGIKGGEDFSLDLSGGKYRFLVTVAGPATVAVTSTSSIKISEWVHVAGVYNQITPSMSLYINGILTASTTVSVPAARINNDCDLAFGNKQSLACLPANPFDLGFIGTIDEVRLVNRVYASSEVFADYVSAFPATLTPSGGGSAVRLTFPANAFGADAVIYVSSDPVSNPVRSGANFISEALATSPTGYSLIAGTLYEIVPTIRGVPFAGNLGGTVTVSIPYPDTDGDGFIDGTSPRMSAKNIILHRFETTNLSWTALVTTVDAANRRFSAPTEHFSLLAGFGANAVGTSLSQIRVYPSPWRRGSGGKFDAEILTFDKLPSDGILRLFTLAGDLIIELGISAADVGRITWNGNNRHGKPVASGVYFGYVKAADTKDSRVFKFAIEK